MKGSQLSNDKFSFKFLAIWYKSYTDSMLNTLWSKHFDVIKARMNDENRIVHIYISNILNATAVDITKIIAG